MPAIVLHYFDLPGRAETARLILTVGGIEFEDKRYSFATHNVFLPAPASEWPSLKERFPFKQVPVLEVDGAMLPQSPAIDRYCAGLADMLPEGGAWKQAQAESLYCLLEDIWQPVGKHMPVLRSDDSPEDAKQAALSELLSPDGTFKQRLGFLDKALASREGRFVYGDKLSYVDLAIFNYLSLMLSGFVKGIPHDLLASFPAAKSFRHMIASLPEVSAFYDKESDDIRVTGYRPDDGPEAAAEAAGTRGADTA